ncbi:MAG: DNRLRE domain-containing protein [Phycisphaerae bacterium]
MSRNTPIFALLLASLALLPALPAVFAQPYTLIVLPDTQFYSESADRIFQFDAQTQWVLDRQDRLNIAFVSHIGDIVQRGRNGGDPVEWQRADAAMRRLDGQLPYSVCVGNHDFETVSDKSSGSTTYQQYFGSQRYAGRSWYLGASPDGENHAQLFWAGSRQYLHLALEWQPGGQALAWAQTTLAVHPGVPTIISTHEHIQDGDENGNGAGRSTSGENTWTTLVRGNPQIFTVLNGHFHRGIDGFDGEHHQAGINNAGAATLEMLADYQSWANGGSGFLRIIRFDERHHLVRVRTFSPTLNFYHTDANSQMTFPMDFAVRLSDGGAMPALRTLSFQPGASDYAGVSDTQLQAALPDLAAGEMLGMSIDAQTGSPAGPSQALLRFDGIFGGKAGQIAADAGIVAAKLRVRVIDAGSGLTAHRMLADWNEAATWNSLGGGVSADGVEAFGAADVVVGANSSQIATPSGWLEIDVTRSLRAWQGGEPNRGWALLPHPAGTNGVDLRSSESATIEDRPQLVVTLTTATPNTATIAAGGVARIRDTDIRATEPDAAGDARPELRVASDEPIGSRSDIQALLQFEGIFGTESGRIPIGSEIVSAELRLTVTEAGTGLVLHRMWSHWSDGVTWNSLGDGISIDDNEADLWAVAAAGASSASVRVATGPIALDVTESVQEWIQGAPQHGWLLRPFPGATDGVSIASAEHPEPAVRSVLVIHYIAPPPLACRADFDSDDDVDLADLQRLLAQFGLVGQAPEDIDADGFVGLGDLAIVLTEFGARCQ